MIQHHSSKSRFTKFSRFLLIGFVAAPLLVLSACNDTGWPDRDPVTVNSISADSLEVWPPMNYALPGDLLTVEVHGLKTVYECATLISFAATSRDSGQRTVVSFSASATWPGTPECPLTTGRDTTFETTTPSAGRTMVLVPPARAATDSVFIFAGTGVVQGFLHPRSATDTIRTHGRFTFRDSTAGHPRRRLYTDSLATCEVVQAAVFRRLHGGDTLSISYRTLLASPALPDSILPACTGIHSDTVNVVENRYGYP